MASHRDPCPFSGIPTREEAGHGNQLRLMAARGGYRQIPCYWGKLEAERRDGVTKVVSWVPIVGAFVPDESQRMRIELKAMPIDVETGRWRVYRPAPIDDTAIISRLGRAEANMDQVALPKAAGYQALAARTRLRPPHLCAKLSASSGIRGEGHGRQSS